MRDTAAEMFENCNVLMSTPCYAYHGLSPVYRQAGLSGWEYVMCIPETPMHKHQHSICLVPELGTLGTD